MPKRKSRSRSRSFKPCKPHQYRHPQTNRCRNKETKRSKSKLRRMSKRKSRSRSRNFKPCKPHQYRHPQTNRCRNKETKKDKSNLDPKSKTYSKPKSPRSTPIGNTGVPKKFKPIEEDCTLNKKWKQERKIGQGAQGKVYDTVSLGNTNYIIKKSENKLEFKEEVNALEDLQNTKVVPKLYAAWTCKGYGYIVIEKLKDCKLSQKELYTQLKNALETIYKHGWLHVDIHPGNIMCSKNDGKIKLIDFGWAVKKEGDELYPYHPLSKRWGKPVSWSLLKTIQDYNFENHFGINRKDIKDASRKYFDAKNKYMKGK